MRPELTLHTVKVEVSIGESGIWNEMQAHGETGIYEADSLSLSNTSKNNVNFRVTLGTETTQYELKTNGGNYATLQFVAPTL